MPRGWPAALGAAIIILLVSSPVLGETREEQVTLDAGDFLAIAIDNTAGDDLWISYEIRVVEGPDINVWFTHEAGYQDFSENIADTFSYYPAFSTEETSYAEDSWSWDDEGLFYLIIDNDQNEAVDQSVTVEYTITWEVYTFGGLIFFALILMIVIIVIVVVVLVFMIKLKQAQASAEEAKRAEEAREAVKVGTTSTYGRPEPPSPYPEWVVRASEGDYQDDDGATGWDPSQDEPDD